MSLRSRLYRQGESSLLGRPATTAETEDEWAKRLRERSDHARGLGYWAGRSHGLFVGWWGLGARSWDPATANLGYRLGAAHWGRGLATEGGLTLLRHAFGGVGLASVWASTSQANTASQRVLTKLSMSYLGVRHDQCQYRVTAEQWAHALDD